MYKLKKYITVYKTVAKDLLQYRFNTVVSWLLSLYTLAVPFALWGSVFRERSELSGYDVQRMISYIIITVLFNSLVVANGIQREIANDIYMGNISKFLFKPINYRLYMFTTNIGQRSFDFLIKFIPSAIIIGVFVFVGYFRLNNFYPNIFYFILSAVLGAILSYLIYFTLGLIAFWTIQCNSLFWVLDSILAALSGLWFPLDIFPGLKTVSGFLPFQYTLFFPVKIYLESMDIYSILTGLGIQLLWVIVMVFVSNVLWKIGIKKYTAVGG